MVVNASEVRVNYFESASPDTDQMRNEQRESPQSFAARLNFVESVTSVEDEHRTADTGINLGNQADAFIQNPLELSYACLLIPRFSDHYLAGDITISLPIWMKEICVSYGWRLESIVVRPGYLQWVLSVPPEVNPSQIMRVTRQHLSQKVLSEFPRFKQQNLSGDFWAPAYSMVSGKQMQSPEAISSFIQLTRKQQGIY